MKKRILSCIAITLMTCMCIFCTTVNGEEIKDFYTPIDQDANKPVSEPVTLTVDDSNFESTLKGRIFQKGDKIVFNSIIRESGSESSPSTQYEGFQIIDGIDGPDITSTIASIDVKSEFDSTIAQTITFTSEEPIILHSIGAGALGEPVNNISHRAFYVRYGKYAQYYPIEYQNQAGAFLQYGEVQIDKAYITDDFYIIKFYDTYAKEGYHFRYLGIFNETGQEFEATSIDPNTSSSAGGVTTLKTRVKKYHKDGDIPQGKMIVTISMETGYTLKLDGNGGKIDGISSKIFELKNKYADINVANYNTPIREGFAFDGWYIDSACTKPAPASTTFIDEIDALRIEESVENITYYAKWVATTPGSTHAVTINSELGFTTDLTSPKTVNKNDNLEIMIIADAGYKLKSVKIDGKEQALPLTNNKITLSDITKDIAISVETEECTYKFDEASKDVTYTIGSDVDLSLRVENTTIDNFDSVYINDKKIDSKYYTVEEGSIIVKIKDDYLKTLKNGTYSVMVLTKDGGQATSSLVIANSSIKDDTVKEDTIKEDTIKEDKESNKGTISLIITGSVLLVALIGVGIYLKKKKA